jgi:hypothetical protein
MVMHVLKILGLITFILFALGSETTQQTQQRQVQQQEQARQLEQRIRSHTETKCVGYGFKPGTNSYAQCLQNENIVVQQKISCQRYAARIKKRINECKHSCLYVGGYTNAQTLGRYANCTNACDQIRNEVPAGCY